MARCIQNIKIIISMIKLTRDNLKTAIKSVKGFSAIDKYIIINKLFGEDQIQNIRTILNEKKNTSLIPKTLNLIEMENNCIDIALEISNGVQVKAAKLLGISDRVISHKIKKRKKQRN